MAAPYVWASHSTGVPRGNSPKVNIKEAREEAARLARGCNQAGPVSLRLSCVGQCSHRALPDSVEFKKNPHLMMGAGQDLIAEEHVGWDIMVQSPLENNLSPDFKKLL